MQMLLFKIFDKHVKLFGRVLCDDLRAESDTVFRTQTNRQRVANTSDNLWLAPVTMQLDVGLLVIMLDIDNAEQSQRNYTYKRIMLT